MMKNLMTALFDISAPPADSIVEIVYAIRTLASQLYSNSTDAPERIDVTNQKGTRRMHCDSECSQYGVVYGF
jgi:hypothetical protein